MQRFLEVLIGLIQPALVEIDPCSLLKDLVHFGLGVVWVSLDALRREVQQVVV